MSIAKDAKEYYEAELRASLEAEHRDRFVAIEPASKTYFIADTFIDAALAAKQAHPERTSFVIRIGHAAALHLGASAP